MASCRHYRKHTGTGFAHTLSRRLPLRAWADCEATVAAVARRTPFIEDRPMAIRLVGLTIAKHLQRPSRPIRSMFSSRRIAPQCRGRYLEAASPTKTADSLIL